MSTLIQRNFSSGEISPDLGSRVDTVKYQTGLSIMRNASVMRFGGAQSRAGTSIISDTLDSTKASRLIPFRFNDAQTYVLEMGDTCFRVFKNGVAQFTAPKTITAITQALPAQVTSAAHGLQIGDQLRIAGVVGMTPLNGTVVVVQSIVDANNFRINTDTTGMPAYVSGGSALRFAFGSVWPTSVLSVLKWVQSADIITVTAPQYPPSEIKRLSDTDWTCLPMAFSPKIKAPTGGTISNPVGSPTPGGSDYVITSVDSKTGQESFPTAILSSTNYASAGSHTNLSWTANPDAAFYNVYRYFNGIAGFLASTPGTTFVDQGFGTPDISNVAPNGRNPFSGYNIGPAAVAYYQQRLLFANDPSQSVEQAWASRAGDFHNFASRQPLQADDAIQFTLAGRQVNEIRHMLDLGKLIFFTAGGEYVAQGDSSGVLRPGEINIKSQSYHGASNALAPIVIDMMAIYCQERGSIVRDLGFEFQADGYRGSELSIFSSHLVDGYTLIDWAYQKIPHSIVWAVRSDGTLLGMTYVREQQIVGWHRHDTDGVFENVCCIPEGSEDVLYVVVKRVINGVTKRFIERMNTRQITAASIASYVGMDATISVDGRNQSSVLTASVTMALSGGTLWDENEVLTMTASAGYFVGGDVGNVITQTLADGTVLRFTIGAFTSSTIVTGKVNKTVPVAQRGTATAVWAKAILVVTGLAFLEGKKVSVFGDGLVIASPNNAAYPVLTVTGGQITLPVACAVIQVGLPYYCDIQTLDVDSTQSETVVDKFKWVGKVTIQVKNTRGVWIGAQAPADDLVDPLEGLTEEKFRTNEGYDQPVNLATAKLDLNIKSLWNSDGRIFIRQVDPIPMTILSIAGAGQFPFKAGG